MRRSNTGANRSSLTSGFRRRSILVAIAAATTSGVHSATLADERPSERSFPPLPAKAVVLRSTRSAKVSKPGYRFYLLQTDKATLASIVQKGNTLIPVHFETTGRTWLLWANEQKALEIAALPNVKSIRRRSPKDILVIPTDVKNSRSLFVDVTFRTRFADSGSMRSPFEIAAQLRQKFPAGSGVKIEVIRDKRHPHLDDHYIEEQQISIRWRDPERSKEILRAVEQLNQVIKIQWERPMTFSFCPPCGMG